MQHVINGNLAQPCAEHLPPGFLQMPCCLTAAELSTFPNVTQGLVAAQGRILSKAGWDFQEQEEPFFIWRINCTHVHFASHVPASPPISLVQTLSVWCGTHDTLRGIMFMLYVLTCNT